MDKLTSGQKHLLRLIAKDQKSDGWTTVSGPVMRLLQPDMLPANLIEVLPNHGLPGGKVRLTALGHTIVDAMDWL